MGGSKSDTLHAQRAQTHDPLKIHKKNSIEVVSINVQRLGNSSAKDSCYFLNSFTYTLAEALLANFLVDFLTGT